MTSGGRQPPQILDEQTGARGNPLHRASVVSFSHSFGISYLRTYSVLGTTICWDAAVSKTLMELAFQWVDSEGN